MNVYPGPTGFDPETLWDRRSDTFPTIDIFNRSSPQVALPVAGDEKAQQPAPATSSRDEPGPSTANEQQPRRPRTDDVEQGVADVLRKHVNRHAATQKPVSRQRLQFERSRPRWYREMAAEAIGVFLYVYPGLASTAGFILSNENTGFSSVFQIGWAYGLGMAFAIICCATTSGGHFSPAITLCLATWQGFQWHKVPYYVAAQVFGAFAAGLIVLGQYHQQFAEVEERLREQGMSLVGPSAPASVLCSFPLGSQDTGWLIMIEFFVCSFIGLVIWSVQDPANPYVSPQSAPFVIGLAYGVMIWGFADVTISANLARDLGTRLVAAIWYGPEVFTYRNYYSCIAIFVNIPATFLATTVYEGLLRDSLDRIGMGRAQHESGLGGLRRDLSDSGLMESAPSEPSNPAKRSIRFRL